MKAKLRLHPPYLPSIQSQPLSPLLLLGKLTLRKSVFSLNLTLRKLILSLLRNFLPQLYASIARSLVTLLKGATSCMDIFFGSKFKKTIAYAQVSDSQLMSHSDNFGGESSKIIYTDLGGHTFTKEQCDHLFSLFQQSNPLLLLRWVQDLPTLQVC